LPRKGVIVYAGTSDWFRGKINSLYKGKMTLYRANVCNLPLEIHIAGLENMAARQRSYENRLRKELLEIMACFEQFGRL